jgi:digeranylgeranylglycerophospholipid reductase
MFDYDVIVVGCGPAGLMAVGELKKRGVNVLGIDMKIRLDKNFRTASGFFMDDQEFNGEYIRPEPMGDKTRLHFEKCGFTIDYPAPMEGIHHSHMVSNSVIPYTITVKKNPIYHIFNPTTWLANLYQMAMQYNPAFMTKTLVTKVKEMPGGVEVTIRQDSKKSTLTCRKLLACDGLQSRIAREMGFNRTRGSMGIGPSIEYEMVGIECPFPRGDLYIFGEKMIGQRGQIFMVPSPRGQDAYRVETAAMLPAIRNYEIIEFFTKKSPFAHWFKNAKVVEKSGAVVELITPIRVPYRGNVLIVSDAAAFAEVLYQGATACGYMAAKAAEKELQGQKGFDEYTQWWITSMEWNVNPKRMGDYTKRFLFGRLLGTDTMDMLFELASKHPLVVEEAKAGVYDFGAVVVNHLITVPGVPPEIIQKLIFLRDSDMGVMAAQLAKEAASQAKK